MSLRREKWVDSGLKYLVFITFMDQSLILQLTLSQATYEKFSEDIWTSLISVDRLGLQVVIVYVEVSKIFVLGRKVRDVWAWLNCMHKYNCCNCQGVVSGASVVKNSQK